MESSTQLSGTLNDDAVHQYTSDKGFDEQDYERTPDEPNPHPWIGQECSNNASSVEMHESVLGVVKPKLISKMEASEIQSETGQGDKSEETKHQVSKSFNAVDEDASNHSVPPNNIEEPRSSACNDSSCNESPGVASQEDDEDDYIETAANERIACIEEEYIQRIAVLEERHNELEDVISRLTVAIECGIAQQFAGEKFKAPSHDIEHDTDDDSDETVARPLDVGDNARSEVTNEFTHSLLLDMFIEFQQKIRLFADDLNGVLSCSEAAIRHARVVQEWATSVQLMFEQIKGERHKILNYIDERERNMLVVKEQFIAELEEQGKQLRQLVEDMMSCRELKEEGENYCRKVDEASHRRSTVERVVDMLLKKRLEEDRSIILSLSRQSKISEMKLFIIHQQSCIQQLQEQNRELRAIIEGLMGPDSMEEEDMTDSQQSGTPASVSTPDSCPVRDTLDRQDSPLVSQVSEVLYCDRGEYLPGTSTDGDLATIQAYGIGTQSDQVHSGDNVVFDPLSVNYVREQCQQAEETERQAHATLNDPEKESNREASPLVADDTESLEKKMQDTHISAKEINYDQRYINDISNEYSTTTGTLQDEGKNDKTEQLSPVLSVEDNDILSTA